MYVSLCMPSCCRHAGIGRRRLRAPVEGNSDLLSSPAFTLLAFRPP
jgi:hypothetical protein